MNPICNEMIQDRKHVDTILWGNDGNRWVYIMSWKVHIELSILIKQTDK